jgi:hypothetical protein
VALADAAGLAGGVLTYHLLANVLPDVGATLPALLLAGGLQWLLGRGSKNGLAHCGSGLARDAGDAVFK